VSDEKRWQDRTIKERQQVHSMRKWPCDPMEVPRAWADVYIHTGGKPREDLKHLLAGYVESDRTNGSYVPVWSVRVCQLACDKHYSVLITRGVLQWVADDPVARTRALLAVHELGGDPLDMVTPDPRPFSHKAGAT